MLKYEVYDAMYDLMVSRMRHTYSASVSYAKALAAALNKLGVDAEAVGVEVLMPKFTPNYIFQGALELVTETRPGQWRVVMKRVADVKKEIDERKRYCLDCPDLITERRSDDILCARCERQLMYYCKHCIREASWYGAKNYFCPDCDEILRNSFRRGMA